MTVQNCSPGNLHGHEWEVPVVRGGGVLWRCKRCAYHVGASERAILDALTTDHAAAIREAVAAEREACARAAENEGDGLPAALLRGHIAGAIRARGEP